MNKISELENRRKIYDLIKKNPGLHMSKIADMLNMRISLVQYHLDYLEKKGMIEVTRDPGFTRCYPKEGVTFHDKKILPLLRKKVCLKVVLLLLKYQNLTHGEILKHMNVAASTLSYHLDNLVKKGVLTFDVIDGEKRYKVVNEEEIIRILNCYKPYSLIEGFKDLWIDFKLG